MGDLRSSLWLRCLLALGAAVNFFPLLAAEAPPQTTTSWNVPARAARVTNPVPKNEQAIARGRVLYIQECIACHGRSGRGNGPKAPDLRVNPGDFSSPATSRQTDGALFWKITRGRTPMPAYRARFSNEERWMLVHFIRTLGGAASNLAAKQKEPAPGSPIKVQSQTNQPATATPPKTATAAPVEKKADVEPRGEFVSRQEYERLKTEHDQLKRELESIKEFLKMPPVVDRGTNMTAEASAQLQEGIATLEEEMEELRGQVNQSSPGTTKTILTGFASAAFTSRRHEDSVFSANFAPLFLWKLSDTILFESELEFTLEDRDTELDLTRAQISYILNEYFTFGVGRFLSPMNFLEDRLHQVTKLPDKPFAIRELLPVSNVGAQMRGGTPLGKMKAGYSFYVANAPRINDDNPSTLGTLDFDNFRNLDGHVAIGGRIGIYPIPELEVGYGFQTSGLGGQEGDVLLQSVDLNFVRDFEALKGTVNVLAQWVWSDVDSFVYDPDGSLGFGPVTFDNGRNGGYAQIAYRPTMVPNRVISRLEPIVRYEVFQDRQQPAGIDETRWSIGLNYWLMPSAVIKAAYQFGDRSDNRAVEAVLIQFKVGF